MEFAQPNFGLLNTNLPGEIATSYQRGQDNALLRQLKIEAAQREQDAARMAMQEFAMKRQAYMDKMQEQDRQRKQLELFRKTLQAPQYAGMQPAPIGQEQAQMMQPEVSAFGPQGIVDAASYADKPIYQPNPDMAQLAQAPDEMLAKGMGDYYDALFKQKFGKDAKKYEKLGKDDVLIDLETRQQIAAGPKGDSELKPTGDYANFLLMQKNGMVPANMDYTQWHRDNSRAGASSVNNYGTPVPAIDAKGNPVFIQPSKAGGRPSLIPGFSPPKQAAEQTAADIKGSTALDSLTMLNDRITNLIQHPGLPGITGIRGAFPNIPGGQAADAQAILDGIKANAAIQAMNDMRAASKTGGAVGQVTEAEWPKLENSMALLSKTQGKPAFTAALKQFQSQVRQSMKRINGAMQSGVYGKGNPSASSSGTWKDL